MIQNFFFFFFFLVVVVGVGFFLVLHHQCSIFLQWAIWEYRSASAKEVCALRVFLVNIYILPVLFLDGCKVRSMCFLCRIMPIDFSLWHMQVTVHDWLKGVTMSSCLPKKINFDHTSECSCFISDILHKLFLSVFFLSNARMTSLIINFTKNGIKLLQKGKLYHCHL